MICLGLLPHIHLQSRVAAARVLLQISSQVSTIFCPHVHIALYTIYSVMLLLFRIPPVHLQRRYMLLSFRFAPLREWERQKENLIAFMEEANRLLLLVHACLCQRRPLGSASTFRSPSQCQERPLCFYQLFLFVVTH